MNGAATGTGKTTMEAPLRVIRRGLGVGCTVCTVGAAGAALRGAVARLAATSLPTAGVATLACALSSPSNNLSSFERSSFGVLSRGAREEIHSDDSTEGRSGAAPEKDHRRESRRINTGAAGRNFFSKTRLNTQYIQEWNHWLHS